MVLSLNSREKEVIQANLDLEKKYLEQLKKSYKQAKQDCLDKIEVLSARLVQDQSTVYQIEYQNMLAEQLQSNISALESQQYKTTDDYLNEVYNNNWMGTLYDVQGKGIPITVPVNQKEIVKAIKYGCDGYTLKAKNYTNIQKLNDKIVAEFTRGLSNGASYQDMAQNIGGCFGASYNDAMRVLRTEGGRVTNTARFDCMKELNNQGCDMVKKWSSALDSRVRNTHRALNGQVRELDEPFNVDGYTAQHPNGFGVASQDINCRCVVLTIPRWALTNGELIDLNDKNPRTTKDEGKEKLQQLKAKNGKPIKAKYFEEFKDKANKRVNTPEQTISIDNFPRDFTNTKVKKERMQTFVDKLNSVDGADNDAKFLYNKMGEMHKGKPIPDVKFSYKEHYYSEFFNTVKLPFMDYEGLSHASTTAHEFAHVIDAKMSETIVIGKRKIGIFIKDKTKKLIPSQSEDILNAINKITSKKLEIGDEVQQLFDNFKTEYKNIVKDANDIYNLTNVNKRYRKNEFKDYNEYRKEYNKVKKQRYEYIQNNARKDGINSLQDIYDALSHGELQENDGVIFGHGSTYFSKEENVCAEIFADYMALSVTHPELITVLEKDKPELASALKNVVLELGDRLK